MQLTLRAKLVSIVFLTTFAFVTVLGTSTWFGWRETRDLDDVERRLVPKLELGPRLESQFEHLRQGMQDAVAAQDPAALDDSLRLRNEFIATVSAAGAALTPAEAAQLRHAITAYHEAAYGVSRRMLRGEAGEALVDAVSGMQVQQRSTEALIKSAARLDRKELGGGFAAVRAGIDSGARYALVIGLVTMALVLGLSMWMGRGLVRALDNLSAGVARFATGDFSRPIAVARDDELGKLTNETNLMAKALERTSFVRASLADLSDELRADLAPEQVAERTIRLLCSRVGAVAGVMYEDDGATLVPVAGYAWDQGREGNRPRSFKRGEGLVGQAALAEKPTIIDEPPSGYFMLRSGLGEAAPRSLVLVPLRRAGQCVGLVELALLEPCADETREVLSASRAMIVASLEIARSRSRLRELLQKSQEQAERLATQEEWLRASNRDLIDQQDELRRANDELEQQRHELSAQNIELEEAREILTQKASELARVSSYKSQFLANMSHELRTPLNSMLLLSHLLGENETKNLSAKQVEYARTIHGAGRDLLELINQVLDLAKIEAGRQDITLEPVPLADFVAHAERLFSASAQQKGVGFRTELEPGLPATIVTDRQRLERILVNLLGNALKFTEHGQVLLRVARPGGALELARAGLERASTVAFAVSDTGIGIPKAAQERIFAPFEQANARADRRYGGTGLGLAIAHESALLLGGDLVVESEEGQGSTFTCFVPERLGGVVQAERTPAPRAPANGEADRASPVPEGDYLMVVEDDPTFADRLVELIRSRRLDAVVASTGEEALRLAKTKRPRGLILDVRLPDIDGWTVMDRLRQDPATRSLPVHFISGSAGAERAYSLGAVGYLTKPATARELVAAIQLLIKAPEPGAERVLVVEDDPAERRAVADLLGSAGMAAEGVPTARAALKALNAKRFACVVLDLGLPDMDGLGLLKELADLPGPIPPIIVHTGRMLTREEIRHIEAYAEAVVLKGGNSAERLVDEVRLFVQHLRDDGPKPGALLGDGSHVPNVSLSGVRLVLADDDMRTVYALSALLRGKGADVMVAENGREALELLAANPDANALLVDVMMPELDGYETLRRLRADARFQHLPAIALTARAMKGERERCLEAGATDYLSKPVDPAVLLTALTDVLRSNGHGTARRG